MGSLKALLFAGLVASGAAGAAHAADLPPPPLEPIPVPVGDFSGWYIRGDVGVGAASLGRIKSSFNPKVVVPSPRFDQEHLGDAAFAGAGLGYQFNHWLRFDATAEYRTSQRLDAIESFNLGFFKTPRTPQRAFDLYTGAIQSSVFLANAYADLGTWYRLTPFIGAGAGVAYNRIFSLTDIGTGATAGGFGFAKDRASVNFAWAAMAGLSYEVTPNLKLELGYRYLNLDRPSSNPIICRNTRVCPREIQKFDLASNDIRLGMRWMFNTPPPPVYEAPPEAPLIRKY